MVIIRSNRRNSPGYRLTESFQCEGRDEIRELKLMIRFIGTIALLLQKDDFFLIKISQLCNRPHNYNLVELLIKVCFIRSTLNILSTFYFYPLLSDKHIQQSKTRDARLHSPRHRTNQKIDGRHTLYLQP